MKAYSTTVLPLLRAGVENAGTVPNTSSRGIRGIPSLIQEGGL